MPHQPGAFNRWQARGKRRLLSGYGHTAAGLLPHRTLLDDSKAYRRPVEIAPAGEAHDYRHWPNHVIGQILAAVHFDRPQDLGQELLGVGSWSLTFTIATT
jgi:hypothetical protein